MSKPIDNAENGSYAANTKPTRTIYLAQILWWDGDYDVCKNVKTNDPETLREQIAHYRFLYGAQPHFAVSAWSETIKGGKLQEKHDLAVRESVGAGRSPESAHTPNTRRDAK